MGILWPHTDTIGCIGLMLSIILYYYYIIIIIIIIALQNREQS